MYKYNSYIWPSFSFLDKSLQSFGFFKKQLCTLLAPLLLLFLYFIDFLLISLLFCPFLCAIFVLCLTFKSGLVHSVFSPFQMFQATSFSCDSSCKMCQVFIQLRAVGICFLGSVGGVLGGSGLSVPKFPELRPERGAGWCRRLCHVSKESECSSVTGVESRGGCHGPRVGLSLFLRAHSSHILTPPRH